MGSLLNFASHHQCPWRTEGGRGKMLKKSAQQGRSE